MIFTETPLSGLWVVEPERLCDERGFFARTFCAREFAEQGLATRFVQCSVSWNAKKGTLRGMHFQKPPHEEAKLVRCTWGAIFDVAVDIRKDSATYGAWFGTELSAENRRALYVPRGFSHGFQVLSDGAEVFYQISEFFAPGFGAGHHHADPVVGIQWPLPVTVISEKDQNLPLLSDMER
ncbi:MAG: dTDP-4-dehydrorhamnose 3,5-epimerase [Deltaproteobacteria bacterium]|nr:dTDP-4-dehydrorhamnose 3,5-epimerase [Deltaproteobacteria bacterium]